MVDRSLNRIRVTFFRSISHQDCADHLSRHGDVEQQGLFGRKGTMIGGGVRKVFSS
jgi:hypothetical protein